MPSRRTLLATGAALGGALAGCVSIDSDSSDGSEASLRLERITDRQLADRTIDQYDVPGPVVDDAITADRAITTAPESIPAESVGRSKANGYYRLSVSESAPHWSEYAIGFEPVDDVDDRGADSPDGTEPTPVGGLPPIDQAVVNDAFDRENDEETDHTFADGPTVELVAKHVYDSAETNRSAIVDGPTDAVERDGSAYAVHVERVRLLPGIATVSAEHVAGGADEFGELVHSERAIDLSGLSEAEREVVEAAIREEYETGADDEAFGSVIERLRSRGRLPEPGRPLLVRYDGTTYQLFLFGLEHYRGEGA